MIFKFHVWSIMKHFINISYYGIKFFWIFEIEYVNPRAHTFCLWLILNSNSYLIPTWQVKQGYLRANNMDFKSKHVSKSFSQCYLHAHIHYIPSFLGLQFEQYTRVTKIAKAARDINKNMGTGDVWLQAISTYVSQECQVLYIYV